MIHHHDNFSFAHWMDQNPIRWIAFWLILAAAILALLACDDNGLEQALADEAIQAQHDETWKADRVAKQISACLERRGPGAVPVFDEVGFVVGCLARKGKS